MGFSLHCRINIFCIVFRLIGDFAYIHLTAGGKMMFIESGQIGGSVVMQTLAIDQLE